MDAFDDVMPLMKEIETDSTVPKNVRFKVKEAVVCLMGEEEVDIKSCRVIEALDLLSDDINLPSYTRAQIWQIISLLESRT